MDTLISQLKEAGQDNEFYPTTAEIIGALCRDIKKRTGGFPSRRGSPSSVLDVGAGNGKVLDALRAADLGLDAFYAIEKSDILLGQLDARIFVVGTAFEEQSLISKQVDIVFSNPPYSIFAEWCTKIIREAAAPVAYLVIPQRWEENEAIAAALKFRKATARAIGDFDFLNSEDRTARAKVHLVRVDLPRETDDAFQRMFDEQFADLLRSYEGEREGEAGEAPKVGKKSEPAFAGLVVGPNYVEALVNLYLAEMGNIMRNYELVSKLDARLLKEFGIKPDTICACLKARLADLRLVYWRELFSKMRALTDRLTKSSREGLLNTLNANVHVDFTVSNVQAVLLWAIKNSNRYIDSQLIETYEYMIATANVVLYASNHKVFEMGGWRYNKDGNGSTHFALNYRIVMHSCGGLNTSSWNDWEKRECNGLDTRAFHFLRDLACVANNLGFTCSTAPDCLASGRDTWTSGAVRVVYYQPRGKAKPAILFEARAFKNGNMHIRLAKEFALALNVEHGRLKGWLRTKQEAASELKEPKAGAFFKVNVQLLQGSGLLALPSSEPPMIEPEGLGDDEDGEAAHVAAPRRAAPRAVHAAKVLDCPPPNELAAIMKAFNGCAPEFRAKIQRIGDVSGVPFWRVFQMWRAYSEACSDQSALLSEFIEGHADALGGNLAALRAVDRGELGLAA